MEEDDIVRIVKEILTVDVDDGILFEYESIEPIREEDAYNNFRVHLRAKYGKIDTPMKIDVTTGDAITPEAVQYDFPMLFEDKTVPAMAYTLETVLAEKYETIIRRHCLYRGGQFRRQLPAKTVFCGLLRNPWLWYSCLLNKMPSFRAASHYIRISFVFDPFSFANIHIKLAISCKFYCELED